MILKLIKKLILDRIEKPKRTPGRNKFMTDLKPSPIDKRDLFYVTKVKNYPLPTKVMLESFVTDIKNQGNIGSCGSHAFCSQIELQEHLIGESIKIPLSELFHYYVVRDKTYMNTLPQDSGQYLRDGAKVCLQEGISPEKLWAYNTSKYNDKPNMFAYSFAKLFFKIKSYHRCYSSQCIKEGLYTNNPITFGMMVQESIFTTSKSGDLSGMGKDIGGHAMLITGYDDKHLNPDGSVGAFRFLNSWGKNWGNKGFGWISYELFSQKFFEAWKIELRR